MISSFPQCNILEFTGILHNIKFDFLGILWIIGFPAQNCIAGMFSTCQILINYDITLDFENLKIATVAGLIKQHHFATINSIIRNFSKNSDICTDLQPNPNLNPSLKTQKPI